MTTAVPVANPPRNADRRSRSSESGLDLETRGPDHVAELIDAVERRGYEVEVLV